MGDLQRTNDYLAGYEDGERDGRGDLGEVLAERDLARRMAVALATPANVDDGCSRGDTMHDIDWWDHRMPDNWRQTIERWREGLGE
jgi:hypothetical protein